METTGKTAKITLPLSKIANGRFIPALRKLGELSLPVPRDMYALMRTMDGLEPELKRHLKCVEKLLEKHGGTTNVAEAKAELEKALKAEQPDQAKVVALQDLIVLLERTGQVQWQMKITSPDYPKYLKEKDELEAQPVELYLDHKVKLPEKLSELNTHDLRELADIVEMPE